MIITGLGATLLAQFTGGKPLTRRFLRARWRNRKLSNWREEGRISQREYLNEIPGY